MIRWLAAIVLLLAQPAIAASDAGAARWRAGDWRGAVAEWNKAAARGDAEALFGLGQAYRLGRGVAENRETAIEYYRRAADRGHVGAMTNLGITMFQDGRKTEGLKILRDAADRGDLRASYVVGVATFGGDGAQRNMVLGYAYVLRARDGGLAMAGAQAERMANLMSPAARARSQETALALASSRVGGEATGPQPEIAAARPAGTGATASGPVAAETADWKVQLGAYTSAQAARTAWATLLSQTSVLKDESAIYAPHRGLVRLQIGPYGERQQADALCARLAAAGRPCFVTK